MQYVISLIDVLLVVIPYLITLDFMNEKWKLELGKKGFFFASRAVNAVLITDIIAVYAIACLRLSNENILWHIDALVLFYGMSVAAVTDSRKHFVSNKFLLILMLVWIMVAGVGIILNPGSGLELFGRGIIGGMIAGLIFLLCYLLSKKQLGAGDVKLAFVMGLYMTGRRIMGGITYGTLLCCIYSIIQLFRNKLTMKDGVPLIPFLYVGVLVTYLIL